MRRILTLIVITSSLLFTGGPWSDTAAAQRRQPPRGGQSAPRQAEPRRSEPRRPEARPPVRRGSVVFVGGYFYDPFFGPYPWWGDGAYPRRYYPVFDTRAVVRVIATPTNAGVYVDGFYAGIVDDFNGFFEGLPLSPGGHDIVLYLVGYQTVHHRIYLAPGSTFKLHEDLRLLPPGAASEPPTLAAPVPPPPDGTFIGPRSAGDRTLPPRPPGMMTPPCVSTGTLSLNVQPATAEVWIDGERWVSSDAGSFVIDLSEGGHRIEVRAAGYNVYTGDVDIRDSETTHFDVNLIRNRS